MPTERRDEDSPLVADGAIEETAVRPQSESAASRPLTDRLGDQLTAALAGFVKPAADLSRYSDLLHAVFETVPMAVAVLSVPGFEILLANGRCHEILGEPFLTTGAVGRRVSDVIPVHHLPKVAALLQEVVATGAAVHRTDLPFHHSDGEVSYWRLSLSPLRDEAGVIGAVVLAAEETTAQVSARLEADGLSRRLRATNEQLTIANLRLQATIGQLPQGVVVIDHEGGVVLVNRAAERLLGVAIPVGSSFYGLGVGRFKPDGSPYETEELPMPRSLRGETCYGVEIEVRQPGGQVAHTLCSSAPVQDAAGQIVAAVSVFQDITELREIDRLKDEFLSIASHELKNPLTVLKGYVQVLLADTGNPRSAREQRILTVIDREMSRLSRLIDVVLDVSRIQLGELKIDRQPLELVALARGLAERYQGVSPKHTVVFETDTAAADGLWDQVRIEQVLANLIDNAVKYSPKGGKVTVSVRQVDESVEVSVRDEGVGIPREDQAHVFEKFYRATSRSARRIAGMGLGLFVAQEIVRAHGGRMWLESELGRGSEFLFSLPLRAREA